MNVENVREGFRRLARVTAWGYWAIILTILAFAWRADMMGRDEWEWLRFGPASLEFLQNLGACMIAFLILAAVFRGLRWIAKGFLGADKA